MKKVGKNGSGGKNETKGMTRRDFIKGTAAAAGVAAGGALFLGGVPPAIGQRKVKLTYWSRDYNEGDAKKYAAEFMKLHAEYDISSRTSRSSPTTGTFSPGRRTWAKMATAPPTPPRPPLLCTTSRKTSSTPRSSTSTTTTTPGR